VKTFNFTKLIRPFEQCVDGVLQQTWLQPRAELEVFNANPRPSEFGKMMGRISNLGAFHAWKGCALIGQGNSGEGWVEMAKHFDYKLWVLQTEVERERLLVQARRRVNPVADPTRIPFHLLSMGMTFRRWKDAAWIYDTILQTRKSFHWYGGPLAHYLVRLYACSSGSDLADPKQGPYADVYTNWSEPENLRDTIQRICDYHVQQIKYQGDFEMNPHGIFPSEILALYRVRERLGLETPWVKHPLLETPFAQVPEKISYEPDPLVVQAMDLVTKLLPEALAKR
jgi:hypothetical protein